MARLDVNEIGFLGRSTKLWQIKRTKWSNGSRDGVVGSREPSVCVLATGVVVDVGMGSMACWNAGARFYLSMIANSSSVMWEERTASAVVGWVIWPMRDTMTEGWQA